MRVLFVQSERLFVIIRVIVYCLKIIGLAPFSFPVRKLAQINPHDSRIEAFHFSKFGLAYNILLLVPFIIAMPIILTSSFFVEIYSNRFSTGNRMLFALRTSENFLFLFTSCIVVICWALRQEDAVSVMNRLLEVDVRLSGLKKRPFGKRNLILLTIHGIINVCLWITHWVAIIIFFDYNTVAVVADQFFIWLRAYIIHWFIIEYFITVGFVSRDLQTVNKYLMDFEQFGNRLSRLPVRNGDVQPVINVSTYSNSQIASLQLLRGVRMTLSELCEDIADFFSLPILFCIASCFIPIFQTLYYMTQDRGYQLSLSACWILIVIFKYVYPIVSLALNVTRARKEAESTGQIVHKLLALSRKEEIRKELEKFSLQLLHEKVNFTAYGFFTLDNTLLQSMLGGVAGYAIILIQFGSSVCNCNCNCEDK